MLELVVGGELSSEEERRLSSDAGFVGSRRAPRSERGGEGRRRFNGTRTRTG